MIGPEIIRWVIREQKPAECSKEFEQKIRASRTMLILAMSGKIEIPAMHTQIVWDRWTRRSEITDDNEDYDADEEGHKEQNKKI